MKIKENVIIFKVSSNSGSVVSKALIKSQI